MSISTQRSLTELKNECASLGIDVQSKSGKKLGKTDYVLALRQHNLDVKYHGIIPVTLEYMLKIESPMLCQRYTALKPDYRESLWDSKEWIAEVKEDGCRLVVMHMKGKWDFYSRNISVKDYLPISYAGNILENWDLNVDDDFIIDCELVSLDNQVSTVLGNRGLVTTTQLQAVTALLALNTDDTLSIQKSILEKDGRPVLQFRCFDCLYHNGEWLTDEPLFKRKMHVQQLVTMLKAKGMNITYPYSNISNKRAFYKAVVGNGGEGCVLKNLNTPYVASNSRSNYGWIKVKRSMSETMQMTGLGDTIDAFVSGFEPADSNKSFAGLVGAIIFSVYLEQEDGSTVEHQIAKVSNITLEDRHRMTEVVNGEPRLKSEWYGKVASIDGVCVSGRARRLKHAKLVEWRLDRDLTTCVMDEQFLNSMIL